MRPDNLLVLGGTGFLGRSLCEKLVERGQGSGRVLVPSRRAARDQHIRMLPTVEAVPADVHDDRALAALVAGRDAVVNLVGMLHGSESQFEQVHVALPRRLAEACARAGVRRLVHVSALGAAPDSSSAYQRSKARGEAVLQSSGLEVTLLRPSTLFGEHDRFMNLFARLQAWLPLMPLASADAQFQPVWVEDVAEAIVRCLDDRGSLGQTIECTGPQVFALRELVRLAGRWSGHARPVIALPQALARLQARVMEWLPGTPLLSRDNLEAMKRPNVASGTLPGLDRLGIVPTPMAVVMAPLLGRRTPEARLDRWRAASRH